MNELAASGEATATGPAPRHASSTAKSGAKRWRGETWATRRTQSRESVANGCGPNLRRSHQRIADQGQWLKSVVAGYFAYHAVPTNGCSLRRSDIISSRLGCGRCGGVASGTICWTCMERIIDGWTPPAVIRHPWPSQRFDVKHPRREPSALAAHARICAGGAG